MIPVDLFMQDNLSLATEFDIFNSDDFQRPDMNSDGLVVIVQGDDHEEELQ